MSPGRYRKPAELAGLGTRHAVVEASAGTGKTFLLEHLVVDLLLAREVPLDQILVVTFTEKAAAELVERIRRKLEQLAALSGDHPNAAGAADADCWIIDDRARRRLRDALFAFDRASISTIHAFCQRLLREHAFLGRRLFDEQTVDEEQAFEAAFTEVLRREAPADPQLRRFLDVWLRAGNDLTRIKRAVLAAHRKLAGADPATLVRPRLDEAELLAAAALLLARPPAAVKDALKAEKLHARSATAVETRLETLVAELGAAVKAQNVLGVVAGIERALARTRDLFTKIDEYLANNPGSPTLQDLARPLAVLNGAASLLGLIVAALLPLVARRLEGHKREAGLFDFQDMLTLVAGSLEGEGEGARTLRATLRARYRQALIDEFQDTDEVQWDIFRRLFFDSPDGHVLTVIGDPKQAIYGFRGADVHTYLAARRTIAEAGGLERHLVDNFRSTAPLIDAYNAILDQQAPFFPPDGGIRYDHPVRCGRPELRLTDGSGAPAPALVMLDLETKEPTLLTYQVKRALLARMAREIQGLLGAGTVDGPLRFGPPGAAAPVRPGDIYVLTRTTRESREVGDVLRAARVPFAYFKQEKLFQTVEAREVLDLLRAIAEPDDPTARARAFITPFFGLGLVDLAACDDLDGSHALLRLLYEWRALAEAGDFETLFARIVDDSGIVCRELFFRDSERALTNYLHLLEILQEEAARTRATIRELGQTLGCYIQGTRRPPGEARDIQRLETEADAVQIMTIHHSKGLEAPVVFLYGGFWPGPTNDVRAFHEGTGRAVRVGRQPPDEQARYEREQDDEERRVLYVALTRAKARLYLPRFPPKKVFNQLRGCYRFIQERLDDIHNGITPPEVRALFHRQPVPCPATDAPVLTEAPAATLQAWRPPQPLLGDEEGPALAAARALAAERAGFVTTSYSAVKGRHGGFVPADGSDLTTDPTTSDGDSADLPGTALTEPLAPDQLPRGRLSGRFLHEVLEELPLETLAGRPPLAAWAARPEIAELFERKRRRHDRSPEHVPHACRLVYEALTRPISLGTTRIAGLASAARVLREMEFLYPIPERGHPLLGHEADADGRTFSVRRGLVKGFIDLLFEHEGRSYVCDWKGDWLPSWQPEAVAVHCERNYGIQAQLYTLAALRWLGVTEPADYEARFGGVLYSFLRGPDAPGPDAGLYFRRPRWDEVLAWQAEMLEGGFWRLS